MCAAGLRACVCVHGRGRVSERERRADGHRPRVLAAVGAGIALTVVAEAGQRDHDGAHRVARAAHEVEEPVQGEHKDVVGVAAETHADAEKGDAEARQGHEARREPARGQTSRPGTKKQACSQSPSVSRLASLPHRGATPYVYTQPPSHPTPTLHTYTPTHPTLHNERRRRRRAAGVAHVQRNPFSSVGNDLPRVLADVGAHGRREWVFFRGVDFLRLGAHGVVGSCRPNHEQSAEMVERHCLSTIPGLVRVRTGRGKIFFRHRATKKRFPFSGDMVLRIKRLLPGVNPTAPMHPELAAERAIRA